MKKLSKILIPMLVLATLLISACAGAAVPADTSVSTKVQAAPVEFTGVIESISTDGTTWVISGKTIQVDPAIARDSSFNVGDTVKVEAEVAADGTIVMKSVEFSAGEADNSNDANSNSNGNGNSNDTNGNDDNGNDSNSNDDNGNDSNSNDDNGNDSNSNDDNGNDSNSNDDNGGNANDDSGNDDNSNGG